MSISTLRPRQKYRLLADYIPKFTQISVFVSKVQMCDPDMANHQVVSRIHVDQEPRCHD